jgi:hypothetical protein
MKDDGVFDWKTNHDQIRIRAHESTSIRLLQPKKNYICVHRCSNVHRLNSAGQFLRTCAIVTTFAQFIKKYQMVIPWSLRKSKSGDGGLRVNNIDPKGDPS